MLPPIFQSFSPSWCYKLVIGNQIYASCSWVFLSILLHTNLTEMSAAFAVLVSVERFVISSWLGALISELVSITTVYQGQPSSTLRLCKGLKNKILPRAEHFEYQCP